MTGAAFWGAGLTTNNKPPTIISYPTPIVSIFDPVVASLCQLYPKIIYNKIAYNWAIFGFFK
ncbi:hypothetical protein CEN45_06720 [Fischerella thermalis CCMEE 5198]|nr:hypothetical protein CI594_07380 [Fischerella thermalis CCMEE 5196]PMB25105.1 hypothetical protein CEN45_06720 [Fischerella thermalis CCMEE 5198]PMB49918.1 hypothetical protein CEN39_19905 [Fischerella thermalis CCMEE 5201]